MYAPIDDPDTYLTADIRITLIGVEEDLYAVNATVMRGHTLPGAPRWADGRGSTPADAAAQAVGKLYTRETPSQQSREGVSIKFNDVVDQGSPVDD